MKDLIKRTDIRVPATTVDNKPHCSLMAYVTDDDCGEIYRVTDRKTTKFKNLTLWLLNDRLFIRPFNVHYKNY